MPMLAASCVLTCIINYSSSPLIQHWPSSLQPPTQPSSSPSLDLEPCPDFPIVTLSFVAALDTDVRIFSFLPPPRPRAVPSQRCQVHPAKPQRAALLHHHRFGQPPQTQTQNAPHTSSHICTPRPAVPVLCNVAAAPLRILLFFLPGCTRGTATGPARPLTLRACPPMSGIRGPMAIGLLNVIDVNMGWFKEGHILWMAGGGSGTEGTTST